MIEKFKSLTIPVYNTEDGTSYNITESMGPILAANDSNVLFSNQFSASAQCAYFVYLEETTFQYGSSWYSGDGANYTNQYVGYDFQKAVSISKVYLCGDNWNNDSQHHSLKELVVQYSNDNITWADIPETHFSDLKVPFSLYLEFPFTKPIKARYFRVFVYSSYSSYAITAHRIRFVESDLKPTIYLNNNKLYSYKE